MPDVLGRFWAKVDIRSDDECWPWRSDADTYGRFNIGPGGVLIGAHVFSWVLANRVPVPDGLMILHSCDNKRCANPRHLSPGDHSRNTREAIERGLLDVTKAWAGGKKKAHCQRGHELTDETTYKHGTGRKCARCHNERQRKYRAREKQMKNTPNGHSSEWAN